MTIEKLETEVPDTEVETETHAPEVQVSEKDKAGAEAKRIKQANKTLQNERDALKAKLDKYDKDAADAKLSETEKWAKTIREKELEAEAFKAEASKAKAERDFERRVSTLVAKHKLADPDYGEIVLKGYNPEDHPDLDAYVAEVKKKPSIARLFETDKKERVLDDSGQEIVPSVSGGSKNKSQGGWEANEREIAESMFPGNKERQDNYIKTLKNLKAGK